MGGIPYTKKELSDAKWLAKEYAKKYPKELYYRAHAPRAEFVKKLQPCLLGARTSPNAANNLFNAALDSLRGKDRHQVARVAVKAFAPRSGGPSEARRENGYRLAMGPVERMKELGLTEKQIAYIRTGKSASLTPEQVEKIGQLARSNGSVTIRFRELSDHASIGMELVEAHGKMVVPAEENVETASA